MKLGLGRSIVLAALAGAAVAPAPAIPALGPGPAWTGTALSGFQGVVPQDPLRDRSKATCNILIPRDQAFADRLVIGCHAYDRSGIAYVRVHCEGRTVVVNRCRPYSYADANGEPRTIWGYFAELDRALFPSIGSAAVYFEAVPVDPSRRARVIGPFQYHPSNAPYDFTANVAASGAGGAYTTLAAALTAAKAANSHSARITIMQSGTYTLPVVSGQAVQRGYHVITHAPGVTAVLQNAAVAIWRPVVNGLCLRGAGIRVDIANVITIHRENDYKPIWFDGSEIYNSGGALGRRGGQPSSGLTGGNANSIIATEAYVHDCGSVFYGLPELLRHVRIENTIADVFNQCRNIYGARVRTNDNIPFHTERDALRIQYVGTATTATVAKTQVNGSTAGQLVLATDGEPVSIALDSYTKQPSAVVDAINALPGWSATAGAEVDFWPAPYLTRAGTVAFGAFGPVDAKAAPIQMVTALDVHSDLMQPVNAGTGENLSIVNLGASDLASVQGFFCGGLIDSYFINIAIGVRDFAESPLSQLGGILTNVHLFNCVVAGQRFAIRDAVADDSSVEQCVFHTAEWAGAVDDDLQRADNHVIQARPNPITSTNGTAGGSIETLFADAAQGDFTPVGVIAGKRVTPLVPFDLNDNARGASSTIGAVAA